MNKKMSKFEPYRDVIGNKSMKQILENWEGSKEQKEVYEYMENKVGTHDHEDIFRDFNVTMRKKWRTEKKNVKREGESARRI